MDVPELMHMNVREHPTNLFYKQWDSIVLTVLVSCCSLQSQVKTLARILHRMIILSSFFLVFSLLPATLSKNPKLGLVIAEGGDILQADIQKTDLQSAISWQYNWASSPPVIPGVEAIPMQWGAEGIELFASNVIAQGAKTVLVRYHLG
jgi:hypothetical protein